jgi:GNAT superfamily N-acetyltransferase
VEVRHFQEHDQTALLELLQAAFGHWPTEMDEVARTFFRWKYFECPFGEPLLLVAESAGELVGCEGRLPWRFRTGQRLLKTMRGADLAVHPAHRRRGISMLFREAIVYPDDVALAWGNPNAQSRPGTIKSGRITVGTPPHFIRPCRPLWRSLTRSSSSTPESVPIEALPAADVLDDAAYLSQLLAQLQLPGDRLTTDRNLDYLRWRYGRFSAYRAVRADTGEGARGIAIFRLRQRGRLWVSDVCELLVERNDHRVARQLLRQVARAAPAAFMCCCFDSPAEATRCGFVQYPSNTIVMATVLHRNLEPDPTRRASWALALGDLELL